MATRLIYQHTPKTGGSSLKLAIESNYKKKELMYLYDVENREARKDLTWYRNYYCGLSARKKRRIKCILGHSAAGFVGVLDEPFKAFTLLRDPVDRAISLYYYGLSLPDSTQYMFARIIKDNNLTLEQIFGDDLNNWTDGDDPFSPFNEFFNGQIRSILRPRRHELKWFLCGPKERNESLEEETLRAALDILDKHYVVGFQEHFKESLDLFARRFGWKNEPYRRVNVTPNRPSVEELSTSLRNLILAQNMLDSALYQTLHRRFSEEIEK